jgi:methanol--5-hydroxybenzimidazolylcobamide Co-methyltransferase
MLEQEHVFQQTNYPEWAGECTQIQAEILERYYDEYGISVSLRQTPADIRIEERSPGLRGSDYDNKSHRIHVEASAANGASCVAIELLVENLYLTMV